MVGKIKCPNCKVVSTDDDFDNGIERIAFTCFDDGIWHCECFDCNCEWKQNGMYGKPFDIKKE